jgi:hypothetical protein
VEGQLLLTDAQIRSEEKDCAGILEHYFAGVARKSGELKLPSIEMAEWIATMITIPILTGFISSFLWENFKDLRSKSHAEEARKALKNEPIPEQPAIAEEIVVEYLSIKLTESVVAADARTIVTRQYQSTRRKTYR